MAKDYQKNMRNAAKAGTTTTTTTSGMTGKTSEEYATELGAGRANQSQAVTGRVGKSWSPSKEASEFNEFATELATGKNAAQKTGKSGLTNKNKS